MLLAANCTQNNFNAILISTKQTPVHSDVSKKTVFAVNRKPEDVLVLSLVWHLQNNQPVCVYEADTSATGALLDRECTRRDSNPQHWQCWCNTIVLDQWLMTKMKADSVPVLRYLLNIYISGLLQKL